MASLMLGLRSKFMDSITTSAPHVEVTGKPLWSPSRLFAASPFEQDNTLPTFIRPLRPPPSRPEKRLKTYRQLVRLIESVDGVVAAAPQVRGKALLVYGNICGTPSAI
jgi:ABC-type lipoprotein release transport system permease subunit